MIFSPASSAQLLPNDLENFTEIANHLIIPKTDHAIAAGHEFAIAGCVFLASERMWPKSCSPTRLTDAARWSYRPG